METKYKEIKIPLIKNKELINEANIILLQQKLDALTEKLDNQEAELVQVKKATSKNDITNKLNCIISILNIIVLALLVILNLKIK